MLRFLVAARDVNVLMSLHAIRRDLIRQHISGDLSRVEEGVTEHTHTHTTRQLPSTDVLPDLFS